MGIDKFRRKAVFIGSINLSGGVYQGAGAAIKLGTSYATALSTATADTKFVTMYFKNTATSGDNRGMYLRLYLAGAGGGGEALRCFTTVYDVIAGTAHGAHISLNFNTTGKLTGLGVAMRATLHIPNQAMSGGGNYAAIQAEIYSDGSSSDPAGMTEFSMFRVVNDGSAKDDVDDDCKFLAFNGWTAGSGHMIGANTAGAGTLTFTNWKLIKIDVEGEIHYIPIAKTIAATA